jgi:hypothetical protein
MTEESTYRSNKFEIERLASNSLSNDNVLGGGRNSRGRVTTGGKLYAVKCLGCQTRFRAAKSEEEEGGSFTSGAGWKKFICPKCGADEEITGGEAP